MSRTSHATLGAVDGKTSGNHVAYLHDPAGNKFCISCSV